MSALQARIQSLQLDCATLDGLLRPSLVHEGSRQVARGPLLCRRDDQIEAALVRVLGLRKEHAWVYVTFSDVLRGYLTIYKGLQGLLSLCLSYVPMRHDLRQRSLAIAELLKVALSITHPWTD